MLETKRESEKFGEKLALLGFRHRSMENSAGLHSWKLCFICLTLVATLIIKIVRFKAYNMIKK